jgi:hypothetical protein
LGGGGVKGEEKKVCRSREMESKRVKYVQEKEIIGLCRRGKI